jgi:hypothetical protein
MLKKTVVLPGRATYYTGNFSRSKDRPTEDSDLNKKFATVLPSQLQDSVNKE